jgi:hypothetical protein
VPQARAATTGEAHPHISTGYRQTNHELVRIREEAALFQSRYYADLCLKGLREIAINLSQDRLRLEPELLE